MMFKVREIINNRKNFWEQSGLRNDIVLSTRIRVGRNANFIPFYDSMTDRDFDLIKDIADSFISKTIFGKNTICFDINKLDLHEKRLLLEKNIITSEMENSDKCLILINNECDFTILINDTDHFRIQIIRSGFQLDDAYKEADTIDNELNSIVKYAFSQDYGYLTADPANVGTGLNVSVIMHLPILTSLKRINEFVPFIRENGFQITGTLGHAGKVTGGLYLIRSKKYIGITEAEVTQSADDIISRMIKAEDESRDEFFTISKNELDDSAWRSLGILLYARRINYVEAIEHLSRIRLGIIMSVIKDYSLAAINDLMVKIQWAHLQEYFGIRFKSIIDSDDYRAVFLRTELKKSGDSNV
jgi:protein arginine kinase